MDVQCKECMYRSSCAKSIHECRDNRGGKIDPQITIKRLQDEVDRLKKERSEHNA